MSPGEIREWASLGMPMGSIVTTRVVEREGWVWLNLGNHIDRPQTYLDEYGIERELPIAV